MVAFVGRNVSKTTRRKLETLFDETQVWYQYAYQMSRVSCHHPGCAVTALCCCVGRRPCECCDPVLRYVTIVPRVAEASQASCLRAPAGRPTCFAERGCWEGAHVNPAPRCWELRQSSGGGWGGWGGEDGTRWVVASHVLIAQHRCRP
jgi:hypothetical protein